MSHDILAQVWHTANLVLIPALAAVTNPILELGCVYSLVFTTLGTESKRKHWKAEKNTKPD